MEIPDLRTKVVGGCRHTVILGAGASIALQKSHGLSQNKEMPSMLDFVEKVNLEPILTKHSIKYNGEDFESLYSNLWSLGEKHKSALGEIEQKVREWFLDLRLTYEPTIYDYLILGLRKKDCIATFNWDPLLVQAMQRCNKVLKSVPELLFLHGNVSFAVDYNEKRITSIESNPELTPMPILFPVTEKDYNSNEVIAEYWRIFLSYLKDSKIVTVFGYSAPKTDVAAISAMKSTWGDISKRNMEQFEFIDIKPEEEIIENWSDFIHTHHYSCKSNFFDSHIGLFPRRSGEDYFTRNLEAIPTQPMPAPQNCSRSELIEWHRELEEIEEQELSNR